MSRDDRAEALFSKEPLIAGGVLAAVGGLVTLVGVLVSALSAASSARKWIRQMDHPPREVARSKWHQARAAGMAGADAWRTTATPGQRAS